MVPICCAFFQLQRTGTTVIHKVLHNPFHICNILVDLNNAFIYQQESSLFKSIDVGKNTDSITKHMNNPKICVFLQEIHNHTESDMSNGQY